MALPQAFAATDNATVSISVGAASANVLVAGGDVGRINVLVTNLGTAAAWIRSGGSAVAASLTKDIPIPAGSAQVLTFRAPAGSSLYIAAIAAAATGSIYFTPGTGI